MSLTVVLETAGADANNPEFRVAQVDSLDSIFGNPNVDGSGNVIWSPNATAVSTAFQASKVYSNLSDAWDAAHALEVNKPTDLGASLVRDFSKLQFSTLVA